MDPICEQKYNFLQKYVPFLAKLIKLLANDNEKQGKLAQMQLLYDLLNKPDNSVKIETLQKCEEVLSRVFGKNEDKITEDEFVMPSSLIKVELSEKAGDVLEQEDENNWKNLNGSMGHHCHDEPTTTSTENPNKENQTELSLEKEVEDLEPKQTETSHFESSKLETVEKKYNQELILQDGIEKKLTSVGDDQKEVAFDEKCKEIAPDSNSNEGDSKTKMKVEEDNNDFQATKQSDSKKNVSKLSESVEKLENEIDPSKTSEEKTEIDKTLSISLEGLSKIKDNVENNGSIKVSQNDSETSCPCPELSQVIAVIQKDEASLQTHEQKPLLDLDDNKSAKSLNKENSITQTKTDSGCYNEKGCLAVQVQGSPNSDNQETPLSINVEEKNIEKTPIKENKRGDDDQKDSQSKLNKLETFEEVKNKEEILETELTTNDNDTGYLIRQSPTEMLSFKIVSAESLASSEANAATKGNTEITDSLQIQSNDTAKEAELVPKTDDDPLDLLNQTPGTKLEKNETSENGSSSSKPTSKEEDDDDVLLVENRLSPICIDSDPEDEENMKGNCSLPLIPNKLPTPKQKPILLKTNVRKSTTAVMESIRHIINKNQHSTPKRKVPIQQKQKATREAGFVKKDPKALMETIDLLDTDSDDEHPKNNNKRPKTNTNTDDDVIIVSSTQPLRKFLTKKLNHTVPAPKQIPRLYSKLANKSPAKPATAQSNFLNAVNLQPIKSNSANPATFSARLSNKKVIIPNAFYGNPSYNRKPSLSSFSSIPSRVSAGNNEESSSAVVPPTRAVGVYSGVSIRHVQDKVLKEWLDGFLTNFASPFQIASHACFVLLQRVLKYRFFQRLKETRIYLNQAAKNCSAESVDVQMLLDLRNVFLENDYLTEAGRRFCRFATNDAFGKPVALTTDSKTGRVTCRTRVASKGDLPTDIAKIPNSSFIRNTKPVTPDKAPTATVQSSIVAATSITFNTKPATNSSKTGPLSASTPSSVPKRRGKFRKLSDGLVVAEKDEDDNDYTPAHDEIEPEAEIVTERKKSLRTNRTKRKEAGFTYSEDHDDEEFEAIARKIENKKREELRLAEERELELEREQLEQQRKINKKTVAKKTTAKRNDGQIDNPKGPTRKKLRLANTSIVGSEDNDLLTPTWIEADGEDGEVDSLLDFVDGPESPNLAPNPNFESKNTREYSFELNEAEEASQDSSSTFDTHTDKSLRNIDRKLHLHSKTYDLCVHCQRKVPRIVHHYVNEHRSSEVFPSRLRNRDIRRLLTTSNVGFVHLYKGNQIQYAAHCIFCDKEAKFLLPYWFEHFTMHTGEYSFKCSGCHILKPTRSLLTNHITSNTGCPKKGSAIRLVNFDTKVHQIEAHICSICNYVQIHRRNLLRHLRTQHGLDTISPDHIIKVVLLQISAPSSDQEAINNEESQLALLQDSDDEDHTMNNEALDENSLMMQHDFTDNDDLSFMICGMLDVQTNLSTTD